MRPSDDRPFVLHLLAPAEFGGLETVVLELAVAQRAAGLNAHCALLLPAGEVSRLEGDLRSAGVPVHRVDVRRRAYRAERAAVRALLRTLEPRLLHTHGYRPDVLHGLGASRRGLATVTTLHGFTGGDLKNRIFEWIQRWVASRAGAAVAVSAQIAERLAASGVSRRRLHLIPNALRPAPLLGRTEARQALGVPASGQQIGWIGRLTVEKAPDLLVEALPSLPSSRVVFVGDGPLRESLERRSAELEVADRVHFTGPLPRAATLLRGLDLLVLSSRTEGTPMVLLEAMHARVPVVATRVGGVPDLLDPSMAWLVAPSDPVALAAAIREALGAGAPVAERTARAAARALEFSPERWAERYRVAYEVALVP